jgi:Gem-associated protein 7 (Gemin7)
MQDETQKSLEFYCTVVKNRPMAVFKLKDLTELRGRIEAIHPTSLDLNVSNLQTPAMEYKEATLRYTDILHYGFELE